MPLGHVWVVLDYPQILATIYLIILTYSIISLCSALMYSSIYISLFRMFLLVFQYSSSWSFQSDSAETLDEFISLSDLCAEGL